MAQDSLQKNGLVVVSMSSSEGPGQAVRETILGERPAKSVENNYSKDGPHWIEVVFVKHKVKLRSLELQAEKDDLHMSKEWVLHSGNEAIEMGFPFDQNTVRTGMLEVNAKVFVDRIKLVFKKDFCLEHIRFHGEVKAS